MKRLAALLLSCLVVFGLSGCGNRADTAVYQAGYDQGLADAQSQLEEQLEEARSQGYAAAQEALAAETATILEPAADSSETAGAEFARGYESGLADLEKVSQAEYAAGYRDGTNYGLETALEILSEGTGESQETATAPIQVVVGNITQILGSDPAAQTEQVPQAPTVTAILSPAAAEQDHQAETVYAAQAEAPAETEPQAQPESAAEITSVSAQQSPESTAEPAVEPAAEPASQTASTVQASGETVYVTASGTKYHTATCSYLSDNATAMDKAQAEAAGYTPCSRCKP